jgi:hypothetical protein
MSDTLPFDIYAQRTVDPDALAQHQRQEIFDAQKQFIQVRAEIEKHYPNGQSVRVFLKNMGREYDLGAQNALDAILRGNATLIKKGE